MSHRLPRTVLVAILLALSTLLSACAGYSPTVNARGLTEIRVGVLPTVDVLPIYLAQDKGIFEEHGLVVEPVVAQGGAALLPSVIQGSVQISFSNTISIIQAIEKRLPMTVVSGSHLAHDPAQPVDADHPVSVLFASPGSGIESAADLNGRIVSINNLGNIQEVAVRNAIEKGGGDPSTIRFLELPLPQMQTSLDEGQVDAISVNEPFTTAGINAGYRIVARPFTDFDVSASQISVYFTTASFAQNYPQTVESFRDALSEAIEYAREHPDEARAVLQQYTGISPEIAEQVALPHYETALNRPSIEELAELSQRYGLLEQELDWDATFDDVPVLDEGPAS